MQYSIPERLQKPLPATCVACVLDKLHTLLCWSRSAIWTQGAVVLSSFDNQLRVSTKNRKERERRKVLSHSSTAARPASRRLSFLIGSTLVLSHELTRLIRPCQSRFHDLLIRERNLLISKRPNFHSKVSTMASAVEIGKFSFKTLHDGFDACMVEDDDIDVDKYIKAYKELYK